MPCPVSGGRPALCPEGRDQRTRTRISLQGKQVREKVGYWVGRSASLPPLPCPYYRPGAPGQAQLYLPAPMPVVHVPPLRAPPGRPYITAGQRRRQHVGHGANTSPVGGADALIWPYVGHGAGTLMSSMGQVHSCGAWGMEHGSGNTHVDERPQPGSPRIRPPT